MPHLDLALAARPLAVLLASAAALTGTHGLRRARARGRAQSPEEPAPVADPFFRLSPTGLALLDADLRVRRMNPAFAALFALDPLVARGYPIGELLDGAAAAVTAAAAAVLGGREGVELALELPALEPGGPARQLRGASHPAPAADGRPGVALELSDVTLARGAAEAGRRVKELESLTAILGSLARDLGGGPGADLAERMLRIAIGRTDVHPVRLDHVLGAAEPLLRRACGDAVELQLRLSSQPQWVSVAPGRLERVLLALALRAAAAMPSGGRVTIETDVLHHAGGAFPGRGDRDAPAGAFATIAVSHVVSPIVSHVTPGLSEDGRRTAGASAQPLAIDGLDGLDAWAWIDAAPGAGATTTLVLPMHGTDLHAPSHAPRA